MDVLPKTGEWRARISRVIGKIGFPALKAAGVLDEPAILEINRRHGPREDDYTRLALLRYIEFSEQARQAKIASAKLEETEVTGQNWVREHLSYNSSVRKGFLVTGWVLGYSVQAYRKYCAEQDKAPSIDELSDILKLPSSIDNTVVKLAMMPDPHNKQWEDAFGLYDSAYVARDGYAGPMEVADIRGVTTLKFSMESMISAIQMSPIEYRGEAHEHCPANVYIPHLWRSMVDEAARNPALFEASLSVPYVVEVS